MTAPRPPVPSPAPYRRYPRWAQAIAGALNAAFGLFLGWFAAYRYVHEQIYAWRRLPRPRAARDGARADRAPHLPQRAPGPRREPGWPRGLAAAHAALVGVLVGALAAGAAYTLALGAGWLAS